MSGQLSFSFDPDNPFVDGSEPYDSNKVIELIGGYTAKSKRDDFTSARLAAQTRYNISDDDWHRAVYGN